MANKFNLAELMSGGKVSELDTKDRKQIEYIDISLLEADGNNFYSLDGVGELAENIEFIGLQQPLCVRPSERAGHYVIVSGHRRHAALCLLADAGRTEFREVPCIVDREEVSDAMQELKLIYGNNDTRKMSAADISRQAERVEALLYQLKSEGVEFPGRMRSHIAEVCKISEAKLARLKVIREKLIPDFAEYFNNGDLCEASAYALAQAAEDIQKLVFKHTKDIKDTPEWWFKSKISTATSMKQRKCPNQNGAVCAEAERLIGRVFKSRGYSPCEYHCCADCERLASCKDICQLVANKAAKAKKIRADNIANQKAAEERAALSVRKYWERFDKACEAAGLSYKDCWNEEITRPYDMPYGDIIDNKRNDIACSSYLPFGWRLTQREAADIVRIADLLHCSLDYLFGRTDEPGAKEAKEI